LDRQHAGALLDHRGARPRLLVLFAIPVLLKGPAPPSGSRACAEADVAEVIGTYWLALAVLFSGLALLSYSGGKLFGFLPTRVRRILANVAYYLMAGILLWFVVGSVSDAA
jgi:hypothetical protein